jgi:hypothetical protein
VGLAVIIHMVVAAYADVDMLSGCCLCDAQDRILLNTLLERVYCPDIIDDPLYKLSSSGTMALQHVHLLHIVAPVVYSNLYALP